MTPSIPTARGADHLTLYRHENFRVKRRDLTGGIGFDVVYDSVGKDTMMDSMGSLKRRGTVCLYGASSGAVTSIDPLDLAESGSIFITRPHLADYIATPEERTERANDLFAAFRDGSLAVTLDRTFPLADAADAHRALEGRQTKGKLLLKMPG